MYKKKCIPSILQYISYMSLQYADAVCGQSVLLSHVVQLSREHEGCKGVKKEKGSKENQTEAVKITSKNQSKQIRVVIAQFTYTCFSFCDSCEMMNLQDRVCSPSLIITRKRAGPFPPSILRMF